jgi:3-phenylpropionate/cinnamic acid dioxygenase small subunit
VKVYFEDLDQSHPDPAIATHTTFDVDHGQLEARFHGITADVSWLIERHPAWKSIKSIGMIDSTRETGEKISHDMNGGYMFPVCLPTLSCSPLPGELIGG